MTDDIPPVEEQLPNTYTRNELAYQLNKWVLVPMLIGIGAILFVKGLSKGVVMHE